ncbi:MAG: LysM peptidoglycan-binding domain-containing protein [Hyphomicrobiales bacterium]
MRKVNMFRPAVGVIVLGLSALVLPGCSYDIASLYRGEEKTAANGQTKVNGNGQMHTGAITTANTGGHITVMHGDTLYAISRRYGVGWQDLAAVNHIAAPYDISAGQTLVLPTVR